MTSSTATKLLWTESSVEYTGRDGSKKLCVDYIGTAAAGNKDVELFRICDRMDGTFVVGTRYIPTRIAGHTFDSPERAMEAAEEALAGYARWLMALTGRKL